MGLLRQLIDASQIKSMALVVDAAGEVRRENGLLSTAEKGSYTDLRDQSPSRQNTIYDERSPAACFFLQACRSINLS